MQQFIQKYGEQINGVLTGFDRLVFRGTLRRLYYSCFDKQRNVVAAKGMEEYLWQNNIRFKGYQDHVKKISARLKEATEKLFKAQDRPVKYLSNSSQDKGQLAREIAESQGVKSGLVCAFSAMEPSPTFEHRGTHMVCRTRPCHVLYHYQIHPVLGWMHARIQTWFPFNIQVALNGREWLARQLDRDGIQYLQQGNCFPWIEDFSRAQQLMDQQVEMNWAELLDGLAGVLNPDHESTFSRYPVDYYWICDQSEWATDMVFRDGDYLKRLMRLLVRHGVLSYSSTDVMRYFGRKVNLSGAIPANFNGTIKTDLKRRQEGERVKFSLNGNSTKFYDKAYHAVGNLLRAAETTIINVQGFRSYRAKDGDPENKLQWLPMRKGIADLHRRTEISQKANERLVNALASVDDSRSVEELTADIQKRASLGGRKVRGLRPWGDDKKLLTAINHGEFAIDGFRNRNLQALLYDTEADSPVERRRRSAATSRMIRMLRAHGLIHKIPHTHRYKVTDPGRAILVAVLTSARASVNQLNQLTKAA